MNPFVRSIPVLLLASWLAGCASPNALRVINSVDAQDARVPNAMTVEADLAGRAFELGEVYVDRHADAPMGILAIRDDAFVRLLRQQLERAFGAARLSQGARRPAYLVRAAIEVTKFTDGRFLLPDPSQFRVRMEVIRPDHSLVMRGGLRTSEVEGAPVRGGAMGIYKNGAALQAVSTTVPAMAVMIAQVVLGLQAGMSLELIELKSYPAHDVLRENKLGLTRLSAEEIERLLSAAAEH